MLVGLLCAFGAAVAMGVASILQAVGARRSPSVAGLQLGRLARLIGHPLYLAGLSLDLVGAVLLVVALQRLPLFLVQSAAASSVGVTAVLAATLGARIRRVEWSALVGLGIGLILLASAAQPESPRPTAAVWAWVMLAAALPIAGLAAAGMRATTRHSVALTATAAGLSFSMVAIASRVLQLPARWWTVLGEPVAWVIITHGVLATALFAISVQRGAVTTVTAIVFTTEVIIPSAVGLALLGDSTRPGTRIVALIGFAGAISGALLLARFTEPQLPSATANDTSASDHHNQSP